MSAEEVKKTLEEEVKGDDELEGVVTFISPTASTSKTSDDKKEKSEASDVITKDTPDGGDFSGFPNPSSNGEAPSFGDFDKSKMKSGKGMPEGVEAPEIETKEVVVEVGMEGDYYTEIISKIKTASSRGCFSRNIILKC